MHNYHLVKARNIVESNGMGLLLNKIVEQQNSLKEQFRGWRSMLVTNTALKAEIEKLTFNFYATPEGLKQ